MGIADRHYERADYNRPPPGPWQAIAISFPVWLIAAHLIAYLYCIFSSPTIAAGPGMALVFSWQLAFQNLQLWRLLTYILAQDNLLAMFINMFTLFFAARLLEMVWGWPKLLLAYLAFALAGALAAGLASLLYPDPPLFYGPGAPIMGLLIAGIVYFDRIKNPIPHTNLPVSLKTFAAINILFLFAIPLMGLGSWLPLAGSTGAGLAAGLYAYFTTKALPKLPGATLARKPDPLAPVYAVRPSDKTQDEVSHAATMADLDRQVDQILDKVRKHSLDSLTEDEKQTLKRATDLKNQSHAQR